MNNFYILETNGLLQKKIARIHFLSFYRDPPRIFHFFAYAPMKIHVFSHPLELQQLLLYPPGIFN